MKIYNDNFNSWKDVQESYKMKEKHPDKVFLAYYGYESYEGYSYVIYRNGDKYYMNQGSHCSCYGLEGSWTPEEFNSKEELIAYLEKTNYYMCRELIENVVKKLKK